jgi:hypothetical protein
VGNRCGWNSLNRADRIAEDTRSNQAPDRAPLSADLASAGTFPTAEGVVLLAPAVTQELLVVHRRFYSFLKDRGGDWVKDCWPGKWVPHCTAAMDVAPGKMGAALETSVQSEALRAVELDKVSLNEGNSTTDFGAPAIVLGTDRVAMDAIEYERRQWMLLACWGTPDGAVQRARGKELRKGPRGGGRDVDQIVDHVLEADRAYLARLNWKHKREAGNSPQEELERMRRVVLEALAVAVREGLPERGPRGGVIWPPRYFVRRVAWHVLDHAWEIEDRIV